MYTCHVHSEVQGGPEEGVRFLGTWTTDSCDPWDGVLGRTAIAVNYWATSPARELVFNSVSDKNLLGNVHFQIKWISIHVHATCRSRLSLIQFESHHALVSNILSGNENPFCTFEILQASPGGSLRKSYPSPCWGCCSLYSRRKTPIQQHLFVELQILIVKSGQRSALCQRLTSTA